MAYVYSWQFGVPRRVFDFHRVWPVGAAGYGNVQIHQSDVAGEPIDVYNHGDMRRDFTYIDDIVKGVVTVLDRAQRRTPTACRIGFTTSAIIGRNRFYDSSKYCRARWEGRPRCGYCRCRWATSRKRLRTSIGFRRITGGRLRRLSMWGCLASWIGTRSITDDRPLESPAPRQVRWRCRRDRTSTARTLARHALGRRSMQSRRQRPRNYR